MASYTESCLMTFKRWTSRRRLPLQGCGRGNVQSMLANAWDPMHGRRVFSGRPGPGLGAGCTAVCCITPAVGWAGRCAALAALWWNLRCISGRQAVMRRGGSLKRSGRGVSADAYRSLGASGEADDIALSGYAAGKAIHHSTGKAWCERFAGGLTGPPILDNRPG